MHEGKQLSKPTFTHIYLSCVPYSDYMLNQFYDCDSLSFYNHSTK